MTLACRRLALLVVLTLVALPLALDACLIRCMRPAATSNVIAGERHCDGPARPASPAASMGTCIHHHDADGNLTGPPSAPKFELLGLQAFVAPPTTMSRPGVPAAVTISGARPPSARSHPFSIPLRV